jgi:transmembrane sensor
MADTDEALRDEAASWYFRRDAGALPPAEEAAFREWLADPGHRAAYDEIARTWLALGDIERPATASPPRRRSWRWLPLGAALAALLAIAVVDGSWWARWRSDVVTGIGETQELILTDGSRVDLNTDSAMDIRYGESERRIRVVRGEALFTVAKDATRPFVVETASGSATALGTVFSVRQVEGETIVTVLESRVAVAPAAAAEQAAALSPGQSARFSRTRLDAVESVDAEAETAWRRGKLIFVDRPLGEVVSELNRYHRGHIRIVDSSLRSYRVSGVFETKDPVRALGLIQTSLGLHATKLTDLLVLLHR